MKEMIKSFVDTTTDQNACHVLVRATSKEMGAVLDLARASGKSGWHLSSTHQDNLLEMLHDNLNQGDWIDVMNFAGMLWMREQLYGETTNMTPLLVKLETAIQETASDALAHESVQNPNAAALARARKQAYQAVRDYCLGKESELV